MAKKTTKKKPLKKKIAAKDHVGRGNPVSTLVQELLENDPDITPVQVLEEAESRGIEVNKDRAAAALSYQRMRRRKDAATAAASPAAVLLNLSEVIKIVGDPEAAKTVIQKVLDCGKHARQRELFTLIDMLSELKRF